MAEWRRTGLDDARIRQLECSSSRALGHQPDDPPRTQPDYGRNLGICGHGECTISASTSSRDRWPGNLSRAMVDDMCRSIECPNYDKDELFRYQKVVNEPDFLPLHFVRILAQAAKLLRTYRGKLIPTPLGRRMLAAEQHGPLQAILFHVAFWHLNLAYFDRYSLDSWPLTQVGVILWSLSASAHDWLPRETLTRLCASPVVGVLESQWDFGSSVMEARILRPLVWFGLLESRTRARSATELVDPRLYRKAPLFDRFVKFNVQIEGPDIHH